MALNTRQQKRLDYLARTRPNDPEIKKLQKAGGVITPTGGAKATNVKPAQVSGLANEATLGATQQFVDQGPLDFSGRPEIYSTGDIRGDAKALEESIYQDTTRDYAEQQAQEKAALEAQLTQRGIPYNPDPESLWGRSMKQLDVKYERMGQAARSQALQAGLGATASLTGANTGAYQAFTQGALGAYQAPVDAAQGFAAISQGQQGVDLQRRLTPAQIAALNRSNRGGGGSTGGSTSSDPTFGGVAP